MAKLLNESNTTPLLREGKGFRAVLITPGKGSSGTYSEAMLRETGAQAFPPGTHAYVDHPTEQNPGRSARNLIGTYPDGGHYEEGVGLVSNLVPLAHWADWVEAVAPHTGLSIYSMGESDDEGNVTALVPDLQNSVDIVAYPGRAGSGLSAMYESAIAASVKPAATSAKQDTTKEGHMDKDILAAINALAASFDTFVTESKAAALGAVVAEDKAKTVDTAVAEAVTAYDEKVAAIEAAVILPLQKTALRAEAVAGHDIAASLATAVAIAAEAKAANSVATPGFVRVEESSDDFTVDAWKGARL